MNELFKKVGRGYNVTGVVKKDDYIIENHLCYGGRRLFSINNSLIDSNDEDEVSKEFDSAVTIGRRIIALMDDLDMARHNMNCYKGKEEYKEEYEEEKSKVQLFKDWIYEIVGEYTDDELIINEFIE